MAVDTMEAAIKARGLKPVRECQTDGLFLEGGEGYTSNYFIRLVQDFGLEVEVGLKYTTVELGTPLTRTKSDFHCGILQHFVFQSFDQLTRTPQ